LWKLSDGTISAILTVSLAVNAVVIMFVSKLSGFWIVECTLFERKSDNILKYRCPLSFKNIFRRYPQLSADQKFSRKYTDGDKRWK